MRIIDLHCYPGTPIWIESQGPYPAELARLFADLDLPRFSEREAASRRLRELGRAAEGPLRRELRRELSPEQVARIEALLAALEPVARPHFTLGEVSAFLDFHQNPA